MRSSDVEWAKAELESIVQEAWAIYRTTGLKADADIAREFEKMARELLADMPAPRKKNKKLRKEMKRRALKNAVRLDAEAPILQQVRALAL